MRFWPFGSASFNREKSAPLSGLRSQVILIISHSEDGDGLIVMENLCQLLTFVKLQFTVLDLSRRTSWPHLDDFSSIVICTEKLEIKSDKARKIQQYVERGGGLMVAFRGWNDNLQDLFGIKPLAERPKLHETTGIAFVKELLPGISGLKLSYHTREFDHSRLELAADFLVADCTTLVTDADGRPIAWSRRIGNGRLVYWNTNVLFAPVMRGLILQTLLQTMNVGVAAVAGFAMLHVDDFPPSLSTSNPKPIADEFPKLGWDGFMFDIWHRDMMALRQKHDLKFTWYVVMNYHDIKTEGGASMDAPDVVSGQEVLKHRIERMSSQASEDEFGFHGYNHQPLTTDFWPDLSVLRSKLKMARSLWQTTVPAPLPTSWVPANNWYQASHLSVLEDVFPEITYVCSIHTSGDKALGEGREFGAEPWSATSICLPRETYGYVLEPEGNLMMLSQICGLGIWTHFIHPDDVFDIPSASDASTYRRNPNSRYWRKPNSAGLPGLLTCFESWIVRVKGLFPWLEYVTTSEAGELLHSHMEKQVDIKSGPGAIEINSDIAGVYFVRLQEGEKIDLASGGEVVDVRTVEQGVLCVVRCRPGKADFRISALKPGIT